MRAHLTSDHTLAANAYNYCRQDYYKYVPVDTTAITGLTYDQCSTAPWGLPLLQAN